MTYGCVRLTVGVAEQTPRPDSSKRASSPQPRKLRHAGERLPAHLGFVIVHLILACPRHRRTLALAPVG